LQEWLSFVGSEIHKGFLFPSFWYRDEAAKAYPRERIGKTLSVAEEHLRDRPHLVGETFTVADAYLTWALLAAERCGVDIAAWPPLRDYLARMQQRPKVKEAIEVERELRRTLSR
jgi:glutathione S-transferase